MKSVLFENGQRIIKQILDWFQSGKKDNIQERIQDYSESGICKELLNEFDIIQTTPYDPAKVTVRTGVAYDNNGERIIINDETISYDPTNPSDTTNDGLGNFVNTPHSTGSKNVPLTVNVNNYIWIDYLQTTDETEFTLHRITKAKQFYKRTDGYIITVEQLNTPPTSSSLKLGNVDLTGSGVVSGTTIHKTGRTYSRLSPNRVAIKTGLTNRSDVTTTYALGGTEFFLDDHIKAIGAGSVSPTNPHGLAPVDIGLSSTATIEDHQRNLHTAGVIGTTLTFQLQIIRVDPGLDFLTIQGLSPTEFVVVNGVTLSNFDIPSTVIVTFTSLDPNGIWYIYVDRNTRTIAQTQTNLVTTPDPNKLLLYSVVWTYVVDGDLSNLVDYRQIGSIAQRNIQDSLASYIFSKISESEKSFQLMTYFSGGLDDGNLQTYDLYGNDDDDKLEILLGQVTFTNSTTSITGDASTDFTFRLISGDGITDSNRQYLGVVSSITDNQNLTLVANWGGVTGTGTATKFKYHVNTIYTYQNDPVFTGTRQLASSAETFRFGSTTFTRATTYSYDAITGNLTTITRL